MTSSVSHIYLDSKDTTNNDSPPPPALSPASVGSEISTTAKSYHSSIPALVNNTDNDPPNPPQLVSMANVMAPVSHPHKRSYLPVDINSVELPPHAVARCSSSSSIYSSSSSSSSNSSLVEIFPRVGMVTKIAATKNQAVTLPDADCSSSNANPPQVDSMANLSPPKKRARKAKPKKKAQKFSDDDDFEPAGPNLNSRAKNAMAIINRAKSTATRKGFVNYILIFILSLVPKSKTYLNPTSRYLTNF
ncbi:hypothetical protein Ciccas_005155 [Cichlidogyrus casuarinus]|uniref:Uncharacterized protein n=1 Tax=Cichlidogyrus casuarinus TaxID=1844966 RepID=A0ABD2Q9H4_9PLAT